MNSLNHLADEQSFLAQMMLLIPKGHATAPEYERLQRIADRAPRFPVATEVEQAVTLGAGMLRGLADDRERDSNRGTDNLDAPTLGHEADLLRQAATLLEGAVA